MQPVLLAFAIASGLACLAGEARAEKPKQAACSAPEYRQLDFWVGEWTLSWELNGTKGSGRNSITRNEFGPCVIIERFIADDGSLKGISISSFVKAAGEWRQTWMDDSGGYFDLHGGPALDRAHPFALETYRRKPAAPFRRMVWQDIGPDSLVWRWQSKGEAAEQWKDEWVINYSRIK